MGRRWGVGRLDGVCVRCQVRMESRHAQDASFMSGHRTPQIAHASSSSSCSPCPGPHAQHPCDVAHAPVHTPPQPTSPSSPAPPSSRAAPRTPTAPSAPSWTLWRTS